MERDLDSTDAQAKVQQTVLLYEQVHTDGLCRHDKRIADVRTEARTCLHNGVERLNAVMLMENRYAYIVPDTRLLIQSKGV